MILTPRQCRTSSLPTDNSAERWIAVTHASNSHEATGRQPASTRTWAREKLVCGFAEHIRTVWQNIYIRTISHRSFVAPPRTRRLNVA